MNLGYVGNGYKCAIPIDECENGSAVCDPNADCVVKGFYISQSPHRKYLFNTLESFK